MESIKIEKSETSGMEHVYVNEVLVGKLEDNGKALFFEADPATNKPFVSGDIYLHGDDRRREFMKAIIDHTEV